MKNFDTNNKEKIIAKERPDCLLPNLGGQSGLNLCTEYPLRPADSKYCPILV